MKPISSRSAITLRIVAGDSSRPEWRDSAREPTGWPSLDVALDQRLEQVLGARFQHAGHSTAPARAATFQAARTTVPPAGRHVRRLCAPRQPPVALIAGDGSTATPPAPAPLSAASPWSAATRARHRRRRSPSSRAFLAARGHRRRARRRYRAATPASPAARPSRGSELGDARRPRHRPRRRRHDALHRPPARAVRRAADRRQPGPARLPHRHSARAAWRPTLAAMLDGRYVEQRRTLLAVDVERADGAREEALALNDVVVNRGSLGSMIECAVDDRRPLRLRACAPTASSSPRPPAPPPTRCRPAGRSCTAARRRSLLVPVAPHALSHRPIAISGRRRRSRSRVDARPRRRLHCDGQAHFALAEGDRVTSARAAFRRASCIPKATTTSRCCARSCTGAQTPGAHRRRPANVRRTALADASLACRSATSSSSTRSTSSSPRGFTVLTGETGAGKSILLDALGLLLGDRFELRPAARRAPSAPSSPPSSTSTDCPPHRAWLAEHELARRRRRGPAAPRARRAGPQPRVDQRPRRHARAAEGRWARCSSTIHGQHAHQSLDAAGDPARRSSMRSADSRRSPREVGRALARVARRRRAARRRGAARRRRRPPSANSSTQRRRELATLAVTADEWASSPPAQSRLAHAAELIDRGRRRRGGADATPTTRYRYAARAPRAAAARAVARTIPRSPKSSRCSSPRRIELDEAARALRDYQRRARPRSRGAARVEERLAAIHDLARKHRVRPEALPALLAETEARLAALADSADAAGARQARGARPKPHYRDAAKRPVDEAPLRRATSSRIASRRRCRRSRWRAAASRSRSSRSRRRELRPRAASSSASRAIPKQPPGPLARVASGGELSRIALAIQVVASEVGHGADAGLRRGRRRHRRRGGRDGRRTDADARRRAGRCSA